MQLPSTIMNRAIWIPQQVTVTRPDGTQRDLSAKVHGQFAVHPAVADGVQPEWTTLTHAPTGMFVVSLPTESEAMAAGEWLWSRMCMLFRERTQEAVKVKLGERLEAIRAWRNSCQQAGKFSPPEV